MNTHTTHVVALLWNVKCPKGLYIGPTINVKSFHMFVGFVRSFFIQTTLTTKYKFHFTAVSKDMATSKLVPQLY